MSANQCLAIFRHLFVPKVMANLGESISKKFIHLFVAVLEFAKDNAQESVNFGLRESHHAINNSCGDCVGSRTKRTQQYARTVWSQGRPNPFGINMGGFYSVRLRNGRLSSNGGFWHRPA